MPAAIETDADRPCTEFFCLDDASCEDSNADEELYFDIPTPSRSNSTISSLGLVCKEDCTEYFALDVSSPKWGAGIRQINLPFSSDFEPEAEPIARPLLSARTGIGCRGAFSPAEVDEPDACPDGAALNADAIRTTMRAHVQARKELHQVARKLRVQDLRCAELRGRTEELQALLGSTGYFVEPVVKPAEESVINSAMHPEASSASRAAFAGTREESSQTQVVERLREAVEAAEAQEVAAVERLVEVETLLVEERFRRQEIEDHIAAHEARSRLERGKLLLLISAGSHKLGSQRARLRALETQATRLELRGEKHEARIV